MSNLNILDLTLFYYPQVGGAVTTTSEIIKVLKNKGHNIDILAPKENLNFTGVKNVDYDNEQNKKNQEGIYRVWLPEKLGKWIMIPLYILYSLINLRKKDYNLILAHFHFSTGVGWTAFLLSKIFNIPYFLRIHDLYEPENLKDKFYLRLNRIPLTNAKRIFTINSVSSEFLIKRMMADENKIVVIPNGISDITVNKKTYKNIKRKDICFIGTVSFNRGLNMIFPLIDLLDKINLDVTFHIIGSGPDLENLKKIACSSPLYKNKVVFHGPLSRKRALETFSQMDISIGLLEKSKSNDYQLLIKLIESIHMEIPWISVATKGVNEFNQETNSGIICNGKLEDFAFNLKELLENNNLYQSKVLNCIKNKDKFDWNNIASKLIYEFESN